MGIMFSYKYLKRDMLSYKALALLSEFALIWYTRTGEVINVESDDAMMDVFRNANRSSDHRLKSIYLHLRAELSSKIERSLPGCDAILADRLLLQISDQLTSSHSSANS